MQAAKGFWLNTLADEACVSEWCGACQYVDGEWTKGMGSSIVADSLVPALTGTVECHHPRAGSQATERVRTVVTYPGI